MELLTCPACGCSVQVADALLGQRVRCFGCQYAFVAMVGKAAPPPVQQEAPPIPRVVRPPHPDDEDASGSEGGPYCPGCGRRIRWTDLRCPYCGEELEPEEGPRPVWRHPDVLIRRDYEPHRGKLILSFGNLSMIVGGLSLCFLGFGAVLSVPLGVLIWVMANHDLERMRDGRMDPRGKSQTENGRTGAIAGLILGLLFASFYALIYLAG